MCLARYTPAELYGGVYFVWLPDLGHPRHHGNFFSRPLSRPPQARPPRPLVLSAAVAASASQALMSAIETRQMSSVETGQMSAVETVQMSAVETRQMSSAETTNVY